MFPTKCRCGHHQLNFKKDIGPFFVDDCCIKAGYDAQGNLPKEEPKDPPQAPQVESKAERKAREKAEKEAAKVVAEYTVQTKYNDNGEGTATVTSVQSGDAVVVGQVLNTPETEQNANSQDA